jgi:hypothetical protein
MKTTTVTMTICGTPFLIEHFDDNEMKVGDTCESSMLDQVWHTWIREGDQILYRSGKFRRKVSITLDAKVSETFGLNKCSDYHEFLRQVKAADSVTMEKLFKTIM